MMKLPLAFIAMIAATGSLTFAAEDNPTIEELLKTGCRLPGTAKRLITAQRSFSFAIRLNHIVQCRVGYDVTRTPSTYTLCYKLR